MAPLMAPGLRPARSFERLYRKHAADVYRYALAMLRDPADAEDVTQTTFLNAYRAIERGEKPQAPRAWLIAIANNVCRQRFRQASRRVTEVSLDETMAEALVADDDVPSADDIARALGKLAFNQRAALVMRELEGRSYAEIAESLDLSVSAVEALIFRARRALREQLEGGLSCAESERAISRQLDGRLPRPERGPLRAHLRECEPCASLARRMRAQRSAVRALGLVPLPASLASLFGGGAAAGGGVVAAKAAAVVVAAAVLGGAGHELVTDGGGAPAKPPIGAEAAGAPDVALAAVVTPARAAPAASVAAERAGGASVAAHAAAPGKGAPETPAKSSAKAVPPGQVVKQATPAATGKATKPARQSRATAPVRPPQAAAKPRPAKPRPVVAPPRPAVATRTAPAAPAGPAKAKPARPEEPVGGAGARTKRP